MDAQEVNNFCFALSQSFVDIFVFVLVCQDVDLHQLNLVMLFQVYVCAKRVFLSLKIIRENKFHTSHPGSLANGRVCTVCLMCTN